MFYTKGHSPLGSDRKAKVLSKLRESMSSIPTYGNAILAELIEMTAGQTCKHEPPRPDPQAKMYAQLKK
tara:strand:+ start:678 stop:884 length:207 start_codon:yes stop_codon:yes gene_type:complete